MKNIIIEKEQKNTYLNYLCDKEGNLISLPDPYPVPSQSVYDKVREEALSYSDKRRENYEKFLNSSNRDVEPNYLPIRIDIENVSRCNFACQMCMVSTWNKRQRARDLKVDEFKKIIDEQIGIVEIKIQGFGEPTMQKDEFYEMIRYARSKAIWVRVVTNASLLHLKDSYKKLIDSDVNEIQISIDGATKEVFESIRHGSVFDRVVSNCKLINAYADSKEIERTKMWTVVQKKNQHQIKNMIKLGKDMGFKHMVFSLNLVDYGVDEVIKYNKDNSAKELLTNMDALRYIEYGEQIGVSVRFWRQTEKYSKNISDNKLCPWPFERLFVSSDMRVVPCCVIGNPDMADFGSANNIAKVWSSEIYKNFRKDHLEGNIPKICQDCYG